MLDLTGFDPTNDFSVSDNPGDLGYQSPQNVDPYGTLSLDSYYTDYNSDILSGTITPTSFDGDFSLPSNYTPVGINGAIQPTSGTGNITDLINGGIQAAWDWGTNFFGTQQQESGQTPSPIFKGNTPQETTATAPLPETSVSPVLIIGGLILLYLVLK